MQLSLPRLALPTFIVLAVLSGTPQPGQAQKSNTEKVRFKTVDSVELNGVFYPGSKGKKGATILLLPHIGGKCTDEVYDNLATRLQNEGHSVLCIDYRGFGDSTTLAVPMEFWAIPVNHQLVKGYVPGKPVRESIERRDFGVNYYPMLINDVTAAAMFLERKNDEGKCNMQNLIVVGVQDGAVLGGMWLASEFSRFKVTTSTNPPLGQQIQWERTPEGQRLLCCVWVSLSPSLGANKTPPVATWLTSMGKDKKKPMAFIYTQGDIASAALSDKIYKSIVGNQKSDTTAQLVLPGSKASGPTLLKSPDVEKAIVAYINNVFEQKKNEDWKESEIEKSGYVWVFSPFGPPLIAKGEKETAFRMFPVQRLGVTIP
jgi:pimeloyl-ACP methyl ester carboxylesterase